MICLVFGWCFAGVSAGLWVLSGWFGWLSPLESLLLFHVQVLVEAIFSKSANENIEIFVYAYPINNRNITFKIMESTSNLKFKTWYF